jgi:hypothetical protein
MGLWGDMGRLTELFAFINEEVVPSTREMAIHYCYISKTEEVMEIRKEFLKQKRLDKKLEELEKT